MSKKLMLLAAGALSALAFAALPAIASADELQVHCPVAPCIGGISGAASEHLIRLEDDGGSAIEATAVTGAVELKTATTSTGTIDLKFSGAFETSSGFKFKCNSPGLAAGTIHTGPLEVHFINLATTPAVTPGVLITLPAAGVTFECAGGLVKKTVTGNIIGTITTANCKVASASNVVTFNIKSGAPLGTQEHELYTGTAYDLISGPHATDTTTSAQTGRGNITWQATNKPTITC